jgi:hypothetical protein
MTKAARSARRPSSGQPFLLLQTKFLRADGENSRAKKQLTDKVEHTVDKAQDLKRELTEQVKDATHRTAATVGIVSTPTRHDAEVSKWQKVSLYCVLLSCHSCKR